MIQNKMHQFIKGCSKFKPKNKILYISIIYASILFTGCQTVQTIVSHPDYDMFDLLRGHNTYNQAQQLSLIHIFPVIGRPSDYPRR